MFGFMEDTAMVLSGLENRGPKRVECSIHSSSAGFSLGLWWNSRHFRLKIGRGKTAPGGANPSSPTVGQQHLRKVYKTMRNSLRLLALLVLSSTASTACSSQDTAVQHFQDMGFSNVRVVDTSYVHLCGKGYDTEFTIAATNPAGRQVRMNACCGFMRGCVTRTF